MAGLRNIYVIYEVSKNLLQWYGKKLKVIDFWGWAGGPSCFTTKHNQTSIYESIKTSTLVSGKHNSQNNLLQAAMFTTCRSIINPWRLAKTPSSLCGFDSGSVEKNVPIAANPHGSKSSGNAGVLRWGHVYQAVQVSGLHVWRIKDGNVSEDVGFSSFLIFQSCTLASPCQNQRKTN